MIRHIFRFCHRTTFLTLEVLGGILLFIAVAIGVLLWKFSQGPVNITFAAQHVRDVLVETNATTDLTFDSIVAEWPDFGGPISIGMSGVKMTQNGKPVLRIPQLGIRLAKLPLLVGLIKPEAVIVTEPHLRLVKHKDGKINLFLSSDENEEPDNKSFLDGTDIKTLGESFFKGGTLPDYPALHPLSQMEAFLIKKAHITLHDESNDKRWVVPNLDFGLLRQDNSFIFHTDYAGENGIASSGKLVLERDNSEAPTRLSGELQNINIATWGAFFPSLSLTENSRLIVNGVLKGNLDTDWGLKDLNVDITSGNGTLGIRGLYDDPVLLGNLAAHLTYDRDTETIILNDTHVSVNDREIHLSGERKLSDKSAVYPLTVTIPELSFDELHKFWPSAAKDTLLANWLTRRLSKGIVRNLKLTLPFDLNNPDLVEAAKIDLALDYENLTADYNTPMMPVTGAKGTATMANDTLTINVASGKIADLTAKSGKIEITHLTHPTEMGIISIDANVDGPLKTFLEYISREPMSLGDKIGFAPADVKGNADAHVLVSLPGAKDVKLEEVKVVVDAQLTDILLPKAVKGMNLTGGPFKLGVKEGQVTLDGKGLLSSTPIDVTYAAYLNLSDAPYVSAITAKLKAGTDLRHKFGLDIDQFIIGDAPIAVEYKELKDHVEKVSVTGDLTPVMFQIKPIGYQKPVGKAGKISLQADIKNGEIQTVSNLDISVPKDGFMKGNLQFGKVGKERDVSSGKFSQVTLGSSNDFALELTQSQPRVYKIAITGKEFDARSYVSPSKSSVTATPDKTTSPDVSATIAVDRLRTGNADDQYLRNAHVEVNSDKNDLLTKLVITGALPHGDFSVNLHPDKNSRMQLRITSSNAGEALRVMDIYDNMVGGKLELTGVQTPKGGLNDIQGTARITDFAVVRAPVLAKFINLFSLSGLGELLQNKGIAFDKLRSDFIWTKSNEGRLISLRDGRANGPSLGLTFGGTINQSAGKMDISGTFVPMSQINGFFNKIPIIGNLLTGGKNGGIIAATYAMKGDSENPNVMINPLSVLTPGFLRSILFEGGNGLLDDKDNDQPVSATPPERKKYN